MFIQQQCLNPNPYPNPNFFFGFGSSQNIRIISDSDPHYWTVLTTLVATGEGLSMTPLTNNGAVSMGLQFQIKPQVSSEIA
jgi:hypothetical protein